MSQLYAQLASRPSPWLLGRTSAGLCTLQTACPLTVTYSGGSPAADTIAAGSAATVYGGSAVAFDASADVWVVLTVPGSGALQVVKEADLATVSGDWAGLARVVQHSTEPYQPQAYLGAGGVGSGSGAAVTTVVVSAPLAGAVGAKALSLWNGSANNSPPATWYSTAYDDSAWAGAVAATAPTNTPCPGSTMIWPTALPPSATDQALFRQHFTLPAGTPSAATLHIDYDDALGAVYLNGTLLTITGQQYIPGTPESVPPGLLHPLGPNLLAVRGVNNTVGGGAGAAMVSYRLEVTQGGTGVVGDPGGTEGDLLYYHDGAWADLPIGASGRVLTSDGTDPGWATPATSGTVTSVQVAVPAPLSASGGPVTSSGTITLAWAGGQTQNRVLASPNGSSGAVSLRALVGDDIPVDASTIVSSAGTIKGNYQAGSGVSISGNTISATGSGGSVTSVALSLPSSVFATSGSPVTTAGTFSVTLQSQSPHTFWGGPASGSSAAPTFRALQSSDLPKAAGAGGRIHAHGHFL